jgi:hypothetical protein
MEIFGNARRDETAKPWMVALLEPRGTGVTKAGQGVECSQQQIRPGRYRMAGIPSPEGNWIRVPAKCRREMTQPTKHWLRFCLRERHAVNLL